ncbi:aldo/keto reductase [Natronospora cellulosivora (SeqCode)]
MKYKKIGNDLEVSAIALGTWAMGGNYFGATDDSQSIRTIEAAIDSGINLIDTAPAYGRGHSESIVGKAIKGKRDKVIISTKCGLTWANEDAKTLRNLKAESLRKEIENSFTRLGTDMIDIYFIHWPDPDTPLEETLGELNSFKEAGKIRYIGVSNFDLELLKKASNIAEIDCIQPRYSILDRDIEGDILDFCREKQIEILSYGSLAGGILTGKYTEESQLKEGDKRSKFYRYFKAPYRSKALKLVEVLKRIAENHNSPVSHVALNWVRQQEGITSALVGAKTVGQAKENAAAADWDLSKEELKKIEQAYQDVVGLE